MGAKLTVTLVSANLLVAAGLSGLQLLGAIDALRSPDGPARTVVTERLEPAGDYRQHPVRIVTRLDGRDLVPILRASGREIALARATSPGADPGFPLMSEGLTREAPEPTPEVLEYEIAAIELPPLQAFPPAETGPVPYPGEPGRTPIASNEDGETPALLTTAAGPVVLPLLRENPVALIAAAAEPSATSAESQTGGGYIVLGSYTDKRNADVTATTFKKWRPTIVTAEVAERTFYRVLIGPMQPPALRSRLREITADGTKGAWLLLP